MTLLRCFTLIVTTLLMTTCGGSSGFSDDVPTESSPVVSRVTPDTGARGDSVTITGLGFSTAAPNNIVIIGGAATPASEYQLLDNPTATEIEVLTVTVPEDAAAGTSSVTVVVYENTSNTDVTFTVTE